MLTEARWEAECHMMANKFPEFQPFSEDRTAGFFGVLEGPRTGRIYQVVIQASIHTYPQCQPGVYMRPHAENHHWYSDGRLCYEHTERPWTPGRDTFLKTLLTGVDYLATFD